MGRGQWVHASDMAEERVPAALNYLSDVRKASAAGYFSVFHFVEPAHTKNPPLAPHMKRLQVGCVGLLIFLWYFTVIANKTFNP